MDATGRAQVVLTGLGLPAELALDLVEMRDVMARIELHDDEEDWERSVSVALHLDNSEMDITCEDSRMGVLMAEISLRFGDRCDEAEIYGLVSDVSRALRLVRDVSMEMCQSAYWRIVDEDLCTRARVVTS